jgi:hypothetical protein
MMRLGLTNVVIASEAIQGAKRCDGCLNRRVASLLAMTIPIERSLL